MVICNREIVKTITSDNIDIDSDGGNLVTVEDIKNSDLFEIVQMYGYNPENCLNNEV